MTSIQPTFDYSALATATADSLHQRAERIRDAQDRAILDIGRELAEAQAELADHARGTFQKWVEAETGFSRGTAYNLINIHKRFGGRPNFGRLPIDRAALNLLGAPSTPDDVVEQLLDRADAGEAITYTAAKQAVDAARPAPRLDVIAALQPRILNVLSGGPLTYVALRDALGIKPTDRDAYDLRTALDTLYGRQQLRKKNGQIHIVDPAPPPPPAESGGEAPADGSAQGADGAFRILDQPMDHQGVKISLKFPRMIRLKIPSTNVQSGDGRANSLSGRSCRADQARPRSGASRAGDNSGRGY